MISLTAVSLSALCPLSVPLSLISSPFYPHLSVCPLPPSPFPLPSGGITVTLRLASPAEARTLPLSAARIEQAGEEGEEGEEEGEEGHTTVRCDVRDTGMGMDEAVKGRLFRAFSQVGPTSCRGACWLEDQRWVSGYGVSAWGRSVQRSLSVSWMGGEGCGCGWGSESCREVEGEREGESEREMRERERESGRARSGGVREREEDG